jgi:hypothetical protein
LDDGWAIEGRWIMDDWMMMGDGRRMMRDDGEVVVEDHGG